MSNMQLVSVEADYLLEDGEVAFRRKLLVKVKNNNREDCFALQSLEPECGEYIYCDSTLTDDIAVEYGFDDVGELANALLSYDVDLDEDLCPGWMVQRCAA